MDAKIHVAEAMRDYARSLETSDDPDITIAAAEWEKRCIEELERLRKAQKRAEARGGA